MPIDTRENVEPDASRASSNYPIKLAVDLLDCLTIRHVVEREQLVRGSIALALHVAAHLDVEAAKALVDLEQLLLGKGALNGESLERMLRVVAQLRPLAGVH